MFVQRGCLPSIIVRVYSVPLRNLDPTVCVLPLTYSRALRELSGTTVQDEGQIAQLLRFTAHSHSGPADHYRADRTQSVLDAVHDRGEPDVYDGTPDIPLHGSRAR